MPKFQIVQTYEGHPETMIRATVEAETPAAAISEYNWGLIETCVHTIHAQAKNLRAEPVAEKAK